MERDRVSQLKNARPVMKFIGPLSDEPWEMQSLRVQVKDANQGRYVAEYDLEKAKKEVQSWKQQFQKLQEESIVLRADNDHFNSCSKLLQKRDRQESQEYQQQLEQDVREYQLRKKIKI